MTSDGIADEPVFIPDEKQVSMCRLGVNQIFWYSNLICLLLYRSLPKHASIPRNNTLKLRWLAKVHQAFTSNVLFMGTEG